MKHHDTKEINPSLGRRLKLVWGTVRRYYLTHFRQDYVENQITEKRKGECRRCGDCCRLGFVCPFLTDENHCERYESRAIQCRKFPIDQRDIDEVPDCGHYFEPEPEPARTPLRKLPKKAFTATLRMLGLITPS